MLSFYARSDSQTACPFGGWNIMAKALKSESNKKKPRCYNY
ncbi:hypothetical protein [Ruminococcus sp.]